MIRNAPNLKHLYRRDLHKPLKISLKLGKAGSHPSRDDKVSKFRCFLTKIPQITIWHTFCVKFYNNQSYELPLWGKNLKIAPE